MADFQATLPFLAILQSPAMRTRHWRQLADLLGKVSDGVVRELRYRCS